MAKDIRERRAERVKGSRAQRLAKNYRWAILGAAVLALLVTVVAVNPGGIIPPAPLGKRMVHEHAAFAFFVEGEEVSFRHPDYDAAKIHDIVHMHTVGGEATSYVDVFHIEGSYPGGIPTWSLAKIFSLYGLQVKQGDVTFDRLDGHNGSRWVDSGNHAWRFMLSKDVAGERKPFEPISGDYTTYVPKDRDKILMTYGDPTPAQLQAQQESIRDGPWSPSTPG